MLETLVLYFYVWLGFMAAYTGTPNYVPMQVS